MRVLVNVLSLEIRTEVLRSDRKLAPFRKVQHFSNNDDVAGDSVCPAPCLPGGAREACRVGGNEGRDEVLLRLSEHAGLPTGASERPSGCSGLGRTTSPSEPAGSRASHAGSLGHMSSFSCGASWFEPTKLSTLLL